MTVDPSTVVLVGAGTASGSAEPTELMAQAVEAAASDAGASSLLSAIDSVAVPQGTWGYPDPGRLVAARVGALGARTCLAELGVPQQSLVNRAIGALAVGAARVAVVVGGEARRWARGPGATETAQPGAAPDETESRGPDFFAPPELAAGMLVPVVQQYAIVERALCHHDDAGGHADCRADVAALWSRFNDVAQTNPDAAFGTPRTAEEIATPGPDNRPLASPYNKWHASQWTVDQAAALVLCTVDEARRHGVDPDHWVFPLVALEADHAVSLSRRRALHRWPAMGVLGRAASARLGRPLSEVELVEVYSCFPAAVRVQQRELGLPPDGTPTVTGGMAFAGGPFNNFVYQATAAMVPMLRAERGAQGLVTTVCGIMTKPGLAVWAAAPDDQPPLVADLAPEAAAATGAVEVLDEHRGRATVASYTVTYDGLQPARVAVVADVEGSPGPRRCVAVSDDPRLAAEIEAGRSIVGTEISVDGLAFSM